MDLIEKIKQEKSHTSIMNYWLADFFDVQTKDILKMHSEEIAKKYIQHRRQAIVRYSHIILALRLSYVIVLIAQTVTQGISL